MSILGCFSSQSATAATSASSNLITKLSMAHLAVCLYLTEIFLAQCSHRLLVYMYAIGRQMTVLEVENPFLYARSRQGSLFRVRAQKQVDAGTQKVQITRRFEIKNDQASLGKLITNCLAFLVAGRKLKSSLAAKRAGDGELRLWQLAEGYEQRSAGGQEIEMQNV